MEMRLCQGAFKPENIHEMMRLCKNEIDSWLYSQDKEFGMRAVLHQVVWRVA